MADNLTWIASGFVGLIVGAVGSYFVTKKFYKVKYEKWAEDEVGKIQEEYKKHYEELEEEEVISEPDEKTVYRKALTREEQKELIDTIVKQYNSPATSAVEMPKIISVDDFDELDSYEYDKQSLWWYADKVLADDDDEIVEEDDWEETVGLDFEKAFEEFEEDAVYVQNDEQKIAYEICRSAKFYYIDVMPKAAKRKREEE